MPLWIFECACIAIVLFTLASMARLRPAGALLRDYAALAVAAWAGEQSCVALYHFYAYAPGWHGRLGHVPILVPLIWPLVILSAREVVRTLLPRACAPGRLLVPAVAVGTLVAADASLVEVLAVRAGLWRWAEPGHLGVPLIGMLGWGYFAAGAEACLALPEDARLHPVRRLLLLLLAPLTAHALIQLTWWGLFRFTLRGDLGDAALAGILLLSLVASALVVRARRRGLSIPRAVAVPRIIAASLFLVLLLSCAPGDPRLWLHAAAVAVPYNLATRWSGAAPAAGPGRIAVAPPARAGR